MKTQNEQQHIKAPIEIFLDVCKMIRNGNLSNKITGTNESTGEVYLELSFTKSNKIQSAALQNIYDSINEWNEQRYGDDHPDELALN